MASKPKSTAAAKKENKVDDDYDGDDMADDNSVESNAASDVDNNSENEAGSDDDESLGFSEDENDPDDPSDADDSDNDDTEVVKGKAKKTTRAATKTVPGKQPAYMDNTDIYADILQDDDDDEDVNMDAHLRKFDAASHQELISKHHTELQTISPEEMRALCKISRDSTGKIVDPLHTTMPRLTKYEKTRIIGVRASQIEAGSPPFIQLPDSIILSYTIAEMEFNAKVLPFIVARPLCNSVEYWRLCDLEVI
jgi:DNA-directed RNA polymerase subunit K/omega